MPTPLRKSLSQLRSESTRLLEESGQVTNLADGGVAKSLLDIVSTQVAELYDALDFHTTMGRLSSSAGVFLDLIGQSRGLTRSASIAAIVSREDQAIKFFSADGTTPIKTLLPSQKIPSGTLISSTDGEIDYTVTEDVYPDDVQTELFVPAASQTTGADQNVGKGVLTTHNLGIGAISVTNVEAIQTAQDVESDANYRFRISRSLSQAAGATEDAIRIAALSFPGIADVSLRPFSDGVGTFEVLVTPVGNKLPADVLRGIESLVRRASAYGTKVRVRAPTALPVQLTIQLDFRREVKAAERSSVREEVRQAILQYLSEIPVGGTFILNELTQRVMEVSDTIFDMRVLLYRFREANQVLKNVIAEPDELFVPDDTAQNPIRVL